MKRKSKLLIAGLISLILIGGCLAYFSSIQRVDNPFSTTTFGGSTVEKFNPADGADWQPGATVTKEVKAENTGQGDLYVRIKFSEIWKNANISLDTTKGEELKQFFPSAKETSKQLNAEDGKTEGDGSVVHKELKLKADAEQEGWVNGGDGYFYWNVPLKAQDKTENLLEAITLCGDTDMGVYTVKTYYKAVAAGADEPEFDPSDPGDWSQEAPTDTAGRDVYSHTVTIQNPKGYSDDHYTLSITTEFIQTGQESAAAAGWDFWMSK